jgi:hypothetical protein
MRPTPSNVEFVGKLLLRRGVPAGYVGRLLAELTEHREDLVEELRRGGRANEAATIEADVRMGEPAALAEAVLARLRRGSVAGRHPLLTFVVAPTLALPLTWALLLGLAAGVAGMLSPDFRVGESAAWSGNLLAIACGACGYVAPAVAAAGFHAIGRRAFAPLLRSFVPCLILAAVASLTSVGMFHDGPVGRGGRLIVGAAAVPDAARLLPPLCVFALLELRRRMFGLTHVAFER